jgi:hypothetical protein
MNVTKTPNRTACRFLLRASDVTIHSVQAHAASGQSIVVELRAGRCRRRYYPNGH